MNEQKKRINGYHTLAIVIAIISLLFSVFTPFFRFAYSDSHFEVTVQIDITNFERIGDTIMDFQYTIRRGTMTVVEDGESIDLSALAARQGDTPLHRSVYQKDLYIPDTAPFGFYTLDVQVRYLEYAKRESLSLFILPQFMSFIFTPSFVWILLAIVLILSVMGFIRAGRENPPVSGGGGENRTPVQ